jgi:cell division protein DivIC
MKSGYGNGKKQYKKISSISSVAGDHISVAAVIFICVTSIVRATSLHTKSKQLAETEKTMELKVEEAKQEQANLDAQEKYMQTNEYIEDVAKDKLGLVKPDELVIRPAE